MFKAKPETQKLVKPLFKDRYQPKVSSGVSVVHCVIQKNYEKVCKHLREKHGMMLSPKASLEKQAYFLVWRFIGDKFDTSLATVLDLVVANAKRVTYGRVWIGNRLPCPVPIFCGPKLRELVVIALKKKIANGGPVTTPKVQFGFSLSGMTAKEYTAKVRSVSLAATVPKAKPRRRFKNV